MCKQKKSAKLDSGILERYVLGLSSAEEIQKVESLASDDEEISDLVDNLRNSMQSYCSLYRGKKVRALIHKHNGNSIGFPASKRTCKVRQLTNRENWWNKFLAFFKFSS